MILAGSGSISAANRRHRRPPRPGFASNGHGLWRFGPFRASEGLDSGLLEVNPPLQVVAGRHRRHRKGRPRLGDACVAPLLAFSVDTLSA